MQKYNELYDGCSALPKMHKIDENTPIIEWLPYSSGAGRNSLFLLRELAANYNLFIKIMVR